ncbi:DGQHR domain-containing protein [Candidatus Palauibacter sp.]|uniref:DGQHR domain-containing protein n=1 Tax=Candidatus Palauibacter sp. TaxID=3101350 RepID=UPI003C704A4A
MVRSRLRSIGRFIEKGGFFPTNVLVNFKIPVRFDIVKRDSEAGATYGHLYLPDRYKSTWIIDGQHRLYGYSGLDDTFLRQNLLVVAFEQLPIEDEANLFVTINHEQKSVPRTLLDDLQGDLRWGSAVPKERIAALTARLIGQLNNDAGHPLYNRVTRQGIRPTAHTCLTLPQLKMGLVRSGLLGRAILKPKHYAPGPLTAETDLATVSRARKFLNEYFRLFEEANPDVWEAGREMYLCTNVGIQGLLLLVASIIEHLERNEKAVALECAPRSLVGKIAPFLAPILEGLSEGDEGWLREHFKVKYGTGGLRQCHFRLVRGVREIAPEFQPDGFAEWLEEQSRERIDRAESQLKELTKQVHALIFDEFRSRYGDEEYFEKGVPNKAMRVKAYDRQQDDPQRLPLEYYIQFIDLKKIVEIAKHWRWLKDVLDIPEHGEKGAAKNLKWIERLNELRRIPAHPVEGRDFRMADFEYLDWIHGEFFARLRPAGGVGLEDA